MKKTFLLTSILLLAGFSAFWVSCSSSSGKVELVDGKPIPETVDFNFHVKPILSDRCFACHGPDEAKRGAGLRLDTEEGMFSALESGGFAIVKGKPHKSKILERIHSEDPEQVMPPPESNLTLTKHEIAILEKWIDQGAEYKQHWSFITPMKKELPSVQQTDWVQNEIDHFVLHKIEANGLTPSAKASKEALIRRVTFDLTGLPPTLEEVDAFLADQSEEAYEKVVDRLLASTQYGERMASDWLVVARYGDTHGYEADSKRDAWQWRDWVIQAFNENKPYDEFITEQLAGDLLENPQRDQLIATAFNRNHLMNSENGIIDEEWRVEYVSDRTNTTGKALMGLTMECAKCHDHKYDPISQKEYFGLFAFFNNVDEPGQIRYQTQAAPVLHLTSEQEDRVLAKVEKVSAEQRASIAQFIQDLEQEENWKSSVNKQGVNLNKGLRVHVPFERTLKGADGKIFVNRANAKHPIVFTGDELFVDGPIGKALEYDGINETVLKDKYNSFASNEPFSHAFWMKFPEPFKMARIMGTEDGSFDKVPGYYLYIDGEKITYLLASTWDYNYIKVTSKQDFPFDQWVHITATYDGSSKASGVQIYLDGKPMALNILKDNLTKNLNTLAWFKIGHTTFQGGAIDDFRTYNRVLTRPEIRTLAKQEVTEADWFDYYVHEQSKELKTMRRELQETLQERIALLDTVPQLMVMGDLQDSIRPTYVLNRGVYDDLGDEVFAQTPQAVLSFPEDLPKNRLGLSQWLFAPENPLTARVMVNRMWQMIFGKGIVATPDDFGNQGSLPTHPALLDWLAVEFQDLNWDMKALYKKMVMSATYQQSTTVSAELLEVDPNNELLARSSRPRLPAEMIRDQALSISGLLVDSIGGEPVKPYQPAGLWAQVSSTKIPYVQDHGENLYRRSLYTYWKRAVPPPNMLTLDAASRHTCTVKTDATSTPLQALVLLNDVQFVEAARVLAQNILLEEKDDIANIQLAFRKATSRLPNARELEVLQELLDDSRQDFNAAPNSARELLAMGEYPVERSLEQVELAAFTMVTSAIFNLNETISKS